MTQKVFMGLLGFVVAVVFLDAPCHSLRTQVLTPEAAVGMRDFPLQAPISLSSDGNWVAFILQPAFQGPWPASGSETFSRSGVTWLALGAEVWIANTRTREQLRISDPSSSSWSPVWSPNGKYLAFYSDRGGTARLWVWDLMKRSARPSGEIQIRAFALNETPKWSPDSRFVFAKTLAQETKKLSQQPMSDPNKAPRVFRSGLARGGNVAEEKFGGSGSIASSDQGYRGDLCRFDLETAKVDCLAKAKAIVGWWVSPVGDHLAFSEIDGLEAGNADLRTYSLWTIDFATGRTERLAKQIPLLILGLAVSWSPDGKKLAYVTGGDPNYSEPIVQCFVIEFGGHRIPLKVTTAVRPPGADVFSPPRWTQNSERILLIDSGGIYVYSADGNSSQIIRPGAGRIFLAFLASRSKSEIWSSSGTDIYAFEEDNATLDLEVHCLSLADGSDKTLSREAIALSTYPVLQIDASNDGSTAVYLAQSSDRPLDVWAADQGFTHHTRTTTANPQLADYAFGKSRLISWRSVDGVELHGAVLLPPDFDEASPRPLVVDVYGGEKQSHYLNAFGLAGQGGAANHQWLATRGIAVFLPDAPMDTVTPALDLLKCVMPGVDKTVELGLARNDAIAVEGESYGGYSTLSLLTQTSRFKAAIAVAPVVDLFDTYSDMNDTGESEWVSWAEQSQGRMVGTPWQYRDKYVENSPFFFADRIDTPVMIIAGGADQSATKSGRRMFVALRRLGKTAEYLEYPDARHVPELWSRDQQLDFIRRTIAWFEYYLQHNTIGFPSQLP